MLYLTLFIFNLTGLQAETIETSHTWVMIHALE